jgi:Zn finger protein HypA/HybF involved in hydrogenase expression
MGQSIYQTTDEEFINAVQKSRNIHQALILLGLVPKGGSYSVFKNRCQKLNVDISHFKQDKESRIEMKQEDIINACRNNISRQGTLRDLGLNINTNSNNKWIDYHIIKLNIDISHWKGQGHLKGETHNFNPPVPLEDLLQKDTHTQSHKLKQRLIKENILENKCSNINCGISSWLGNDISLHLDHINGNHSDNTIENLRLLCPNCHSQTDTYCGKNKKKLRIKEETLNPSKPKREPKRKTCVDCNTYIHASALRCKSCAALQQRTKIDWPDDQTLIQMLKESNFSALGKKLGVSDNSIRKRMKNRHLI